MGGPLLSRDDLDALGDDADEAADPAAVAAELVAAAAGGRLADAADTGYAYLLAAEIREQADDLPGAAALVERALARTGVPAADRARLQACRERLRGELGYGDGAAPDPYEGDGEPLLDLRYAEGEEGDGDSAVHADGEVLLVWSRAAYEQVDLRWPEVLEPTGAESWEDYRDHCRARFRPGLLLVVGDADGFDEWLAEQDTDLYHASLVTLARAYGAYLADVDEPLELPLDPDEPCWCGSTDPFGGCCR